MKETLGPWFESQSIKSELEDMVCRINEDINEDIGSRIVERTNKQMSKLRKKIDAD